MNDKKVFSLKDLVLDFDINGTDYHAIDGISIDIYEGEIVALVGESGCGKTLTALTSMGLQSKNARQVSGEINFCDENMAEKSAEEWNNYRGKDIAMIFQEPMTALNPLAKVGVQIAENAWTHGCDKVLARAKALSMMKMVGLPDTDRLYDSYPHQLSGGMRQRIMIAMALVNSPTLLIADEPTTALDVTIQAQIMELIKEMNKRTGTAVMLISHDLGLVSNMCSRVYIMYAGRIAESGRVEDILTKPLHPYTVGLINSLPNISKRHQRLEAIGGSVPSLENRSEEGCHFANRCTNCMDRCKRETPPLIAVGDRAVACHLYQKEAQ